LDSRSWFKELLGLSVAPPALLMSEVASSARAALAWQTSDRYVGAVHDRSSVRQAWSPTIRQHIQTRSMPRSPSRNLEIAMREGLLQHGAVENQGHVSASVQTNLREEGYFSEPESRRGRVCKPACEPSTPSSLSASCGFAFPQCSSSCSRRTSPELPVFRGKHAGNRTIYKPRDSHNEPAKLAACGIDRLRPGIKQEDSKGAAWSGSLGGKLDDLCNRTLALEKELRAQCLEDPIEGRLQTIDDKESTTTPDMSDSAVETELRSIKSSIAGVQENFRILKGMVQQVGDDLRSSKRLERKEALSPPPVPAKVLVSPRVVVNMSGCAVVKASTCGPQHSMSRVTSTAAIQALSPAKSSTCVGNEPCAGMAFMDSIRTACVPFTSPQPVSITISRNSPPRTFCANISTPAMLISGATTHNRPVRSQETSPVRRSAGPGYLAHHA